MLYWPNYFFLFIITITHLKAAYATSLPNHCALNTVSPLVQSKTSRSAQPRLAKREVTFEISTAEVDPDYLLSFKTRTISVPEFEEFIKRQQNAIDIKVVRTLFDSRSSNVVLVYP